MPVQRLTWWLAGTLLAGLGMVAGSGLILPRSAGKPTHPADGTPYAVEILSDGCSFDLSFEGDTRYFVAVSSLGTAAQTYTVTLESEAATGRERLPFRPVQPMQPRSSRSGVLGNAAASTAAIQLPIMSTPGLSPGLAALPVAALTPRTFHLHVADGSLDDEKQYASVVADLIADGTRVRIYLDRQQSRSQLVPGVVEEILRLFDSEIIPQTSGRLGRTLDVDGDGHFTVLLTPGSTGFKAVGRHSEGSFAEAIFAATSTLHSATTVT